MQRKVKKKKRRLKKSVKRGCLGIIIFLLLLALFLFFRCSPARDFLFGNEGLTEDEVVEPDSVDMAIADDVQRLIRQSFHIDTTMLAVDVYDLTRGCYVYEYHSHRRLIPASCMKLLTGIRALKQLGIDHQYSSREYIIGDVKGDTLYGDLLLQMDDDPLLLSFDGFIQAVKNRGISHVKGKVVFDLLRTDTLRPHHTAQPYDITYKQVPLLMKGASRVKREFLSSLRTAGITCKGDTLLFNVPLADNAELIYLYQTPLREVLKPMLINSSNVKAECVFYHNKHAHDRQAEPDTILQMSTFDFIQTECIYDRIADFVVNDGSGLSPNNRLTADFLVQLMIYAYKQPDIKRVLIDEALATPAHPVRHGSLLGRMSAPCFRDRIFCKTGTLVSYASSSLTGYAHHINGRWFAFSIINNNSPVYDAREFQDALCHILVE
ncbi:MAG: D-alanyl-D-alanine carboxypeptidase [Bacteroidaceae bacterium]|nr:D-alanyl-D-alanine carboxypeptidase [Bacteroidaceae bacterium]